jgi:hypothetical protein
MIDFSEHSELFRFVPKQFVCFGCFDIGSKHRNKPKKKIVGSRNKPKQTRNRSCFGLFRFEPKNYIFHFEDTQEWSRRETVDVKRVLLTI